MAKHRTMRFYWDNGHDRPLRIVRDPWDEGLPQTTLSLTEDEAEDLAYFIQNITKQP